MDLSTKKVLLVSGCSHSCGCEIEGARIAYSNYNIENSFGGILANNYNLKHINIAVAGGSNKIIISNTVHHINLLLKYYNPDEIFTIVGWTSFARNEAIYNEKLYNFTITSYLNKKWANNPTDIKKFYTEWTKLINSDNLFNEHVLNYQLLKNFLDYKNIKYLFFNAVEPLQYPSKMKNLLHIHDNEHIDYIGFDLIKNDKRYFFPFDPDKTLYNYLKKTYNPTEDGRWHHFGKEAHIKWADVIKSSLDSAN